MPRGPARSARRSASPSLHSSWRARVPTHWGRRTWDALFLLAADYPHAKECADDDEYPPEVVRERRRAWKQMLQALPGVLTCGVCSYHFEQYMRRDGGRPMEAALRDREALLKWLYAAKDEVNRRNRVRRSPPYERVRRTYIPKCSKHG